MMAMVATMGTMAVRVAVVPVVMAMAVARIAVAMVVMAVAVIDRSARRGHDNGRHTWAWRNHHSRRVSNDHPRKRRQRDANVYVYSGLRSCSRSQENCCEHCEFFHTPCSTGNAALGYGVFATFSSFFIE
jgi:hypothetical protein